MKIKVSEATPAQLDWLVAKCEGHHLPQIYAYTDVWLAARRFSSDWAQGGPIIGNHITKLEDYGDCWGAEGPDALEQFGPTPLIAAMRCYVSSKLGGEVEVPEELK